jgi:hypothetical protein
MTTCMLIVAYALASKQVHYLLDLCIVSAHKLEALIP